MIYLNNAATSFPKPSSVHQAVIEYLQNPPLQQERMGYSKSSSDRVWKCREKLAKFFGTQHPERIIFTSGSTEALNLAIFGLDLQSGHVITTAIEHNSVIRPLKKLEYSHIIELTIVPCDSAGYVDPADIAQAIRPNTKAIVFNHCSNVTGSCINISSVTEIANAKKIPVLVDVSQSAGTLAIDIEKDHIDLLAFTGHKSLYGLPGIGGLYIAPEIHLKPLKVGGTGIKSELLEQPQDMPIYYESGTLNLPGIVSLAAGIDFVMEQGIEEIHHRKYTLIRLLYEELARMPEVRLIGNLSQEPTLLSFQIQGKEPGDVAYMLDTCFDIAVRSGLHCAPLIHQALGTYPRGSIRASPSYFTTEEEIMTLIHAIQKIVTL